MPKTSLVAVLALVTACSSPRSQAQPDSLPQQSTAASNQPTMTPGVCGYWETADSASRSSCRQSLGDRGPRLIGLLAASDCAYYETMVLDSLKACLNRSDSTARQCPVVHSWRVRQADGVAREGEWRRCGPQDGAYSGDSIIWPIHFLLIRRDTMTASPVIFSFTNAGEPASGGIDTAFAIDLDGDQTDELFFVDHAYGTGAMFQDCALAVNGGRLQCWDGPAFPDQKSFLKSGELLYKGWLRSPGGPGADRDTASLAFATGKSIWYQTLIYREGDANCCPTGNASVWVEARPRNGRFETGLVLRVREDSNQAVIGTDTLHR